MNKTKYSKTKKNNTIRKEKIFTRKHYYSNDGMLTTVWGPSTWHLLHTLSFNYPVNPTCEDKQNYRDFILSLQNVLPCGKCRKNFKKNLKKLPLKWDNMENRDMFSLYVYKLHELINKMLGKTSGLTYKDVRERYEHFRARCTTPIDDITTLIKPLKKEKGCTEPLYGEKAKCILKIVPENTKCETFEINEKCIKKRLVHTNTLSD